MAGLKGIQGIKGIGGIRGLKGSGGGKVTPKTGSPLGMMKKFMLYRNAFGNVPGVRARMGPMGPNMGKPTSIAGGIGKQPPGSGPGGIQDIAAFHRMGLL